MALEGEYDYRAQITIQGGYEGEIQGVSPTDNSWHTTSETSGTATYTYYYADSNSPASWTADQKNANSTQVHMNVTDTWTAVIDSDNNIALTVQTTINWVRRQNLVGNPNNAGDYRRDIVISRYEGGPAYITINNDAINYEGTIGGPWPYTLGAETIVLKPGSAQPRSSLYVQNHVSGFGWTPDYYDKIWVGTSFRNNMPADYRPGMTWTGLVWGSNNRKRGNCAVYTGNNWQECRTENGGTASDNPPFAYNNGWKNQYKIGQRD